MRQGESLRWEAEERGRERATRPKSGEEAQHRIDRGLGLAVCSLRWYTIRLTMVVVSLRGKAARKKSAERK
jgi:hypothetical protein